MKSVAILVLGIGFLAGYTTGCTSLELHSTSDLDAAEIEAYKDAEDLELGLLPEDLSDLDPALRAELEKELEAEILAASPLGFNPLSNELHEMAREDLKSVADYAKERNKKIVLGSVSTDLGKKRLQSVKDYLVSQGVSDGQIQVSASKKKTQKKNDDAVTFEFQ